MTTGAPCSWKRRATRSDSAFEAEYGVRMAPTAASGVSVARDGSSAAKVETWTTGSQPASDAAPSTISVALALLAAISGASRGSNENTAAGSTASQPETALATDC
jgi:hypothetical protein